MYNVPYCNNSFESIPSCGLFFFEANLEVITELLMSQSALYSLIQSSMILFSSETFA